MEQGKKSSTTLGRLLSERRRRVRREIDGREVIASHHAFDRQERMQLKRMERRRCIRRQGEVVARVAQVR